MLVDYQNTLCQDNKLIVPTAQQFNDWLAIILVVLQEKSAIELTLRIVEETEIKQLNTDFRQKNYATNVLSFVFEPPPGGVGNYLGDIVICAQVVTDEAKEQGKKLEHHWMHMFVHGCLHLYGYDHLLDAEALKMENLEIIILKKMGILSPYE
jgi:probable rRNA maturation factor